MYSKSRIAKVPLTICGLCIAGMLYNLSPVAFPSLTSARIGLVGLTIFAALRLGEVNRIITEKTLWFGTVQLLLLAYNSLLWARSDYLDPQQLSRNFHFFFYCFLGPALTAVAVRNCVKTFNSIVALVMTIYAVLTFLAFLNADWRQFGIKTFLRVTNFVDSSGGRVSAFGYGGADTSILQFVGVVAVTAMLRNAKGALTKVLLAGATVFCGLATSLMGRTGMICTLVFLAAYVIELGIRRRYKAFFGSIVMSILIVGLWSALWDFLAQKNDDSVFMRQWVERVFGRELVDETNADQFTEIPVLTLETLVGTGEISRSDGRNSSGHDSGYIQTYYASGLIGGLLFYGSYIAFLGVLAYRSKVDSGVIVAIGIMFFAEVKEPFIFKYAISYYLSSLLLISYLRAQEDSVSARRRGAILPPIRRSPVRLSGS